MADVKKIVTVSITRETSFPSSDSFGNGGIIAEFSPGNLNTPMQGATGRYKKYTSLKTMEQDGWLETDPIYRAAETFYGAPNNPGVFVVGLRKAEDDSWSDALEAVQAENDDWYVFTCILLDAELATPALFNAAIDEIALWTEFKVKLFGFTTAQKGAIGELVVLSKGYFTSGKPGDLENFQAVKKGQFYISKDSGTPVIVKDINMTASATAGQFESGSISGNLSNFQAVSDGEFSLALDGAAAVDVAGIDLTSATSFASVASLVEAAIQAIPALAGVTVVYNSDVKTLSFVSDSTGATSTVVIAVAGTPAGTDLTGANYFNGGESEPGKAAGTVSSYADVATALQTAILATTITGVTVEYVTADNRFVFTSATDGKTSSIEITAVTDQEGDDLTASDYLNGGIRTWGTDLGAVPGTDDIGTFLKGKYDRTFWAYHEDAPDADHIDVADAVWLSVGWASYVCGNFVPAEATWAFKDLGANLQLSVSAINNAQDEFVRGNNGNTFTPTGGTNVTLDGKVCGGEYIDIMRGTDWLQARLVEGAYKPLVDNPRVAFTDAGIGLEENAIRGVLTEAEVNLLDAAETELIVPKEDDIPKTDKAVRTANGFEFSGVYQGAIQKVGISGTIGV